MIGPARPLPAPRRLLIGASLLLAALAFAARAEVPEIASIDQALEKLVPSVAGVAEQLDHAVSAGRRLEADLPDGQERQQRRAELEQARRSFEQLTAAVDGAPGGGVVPAAPALEAYLAHPDPRTWPMAAEAIGNARRNLGEAAQRLDDLLPKLPVQSGDLAAAMASALDPRAIVLPQLVTLPAPTDPPELAQLRQLLSVMGSLSERFRSIARAIAGYDGAQSG